MNYKKTVRELLDRLDPKQYIAVGSGLPRRTKDVQPGSGFYFIGTVARYWKDIDGINGFFAKSSENYIPLQDRKLTDIRNRHLPGEPPMLAILGEGTEAGRCWVLGEYDKSFKAPPTKIMDTAGLHNLRMAISMRAVGDYENAFSRGDKDDMAGPEHFFESDWGELITGCDGEKIEEVCKLRAKYREWRDKHKCRKCKRQKCIHYDGTHFTTMEKGKLVCLKEKEAKENESNS